jgi:PAS domain S-box-containing protein
MDYLRMLFATSDEEEFKRFMRLVEKEKLPYDVRSVRDASQIEDMFSSGAIDFVISDAEFNQGKLFSWLELWPIPSIIMVDFRLEQGQVRWPKDESTSILPRDESYRHVSLIPSLIKKTLEVRESIRRQGAHLLLTEQRYHQLMESLPDIVYILDSHGRFSFVNDEIRSLGYSPAELIGKHFSEILDPSCVKEVSRDMVLPPLKGKQTGVHGAPKLFDERRSGPRMTRNLVLKLKRKGSSDGDVVMAVDAFGEVSAKGVGLPELADGFSTVGIIRDVSKREERKAELEGALDSKDRLLKEIHHRVSNNLQLVSSLMYLRFEPVKDAEARKALDASQAQIQTLSLIHERLYQGGDYRVLDMGLILSELVEHVAASLEAEGRADVAIDAGGISLEADQGIALALIAGELVTNAYKHAYEAGEEGRIALKLEALPEGRYRFSVSDAGKGMPEGYRGGLGLSLAEALASRLGCKAFQYGPGIEGRGLAVMLEFKA